MTSRVEDLVVNPGTAAAPEPKNIRGGIPSAAWSRDELYARADFEYQRVERRRKDAPRYWILGKVLRLVRTDFSLSQWKTWRDAHSIDRTRAGRAMLLARAFASAKKIRGLPLLTALALAREILHLPERRSTADARLRRSLSAMKKSLQERLDEFTAITSTDGVRRHIAELRRKLTALEHACTAHEKARRCSLSRRERAGVRAANKSKVESPKSKSLAPNPRSLAPRPPSKI